MPSFKGRDLLLKIGDGGDPEVFSTIGAARAVSLSVSNRAEDDTRTDAGGVEALNALAGAQSVTVRLEGLFKDAAAEELLRAAAFGRTLDNYRLIFPNGDMYAAAFVVREYVRTGSHDGVEGFSATLRRSGAGTYTPGG